MNAAIVLNVSACSYLFETVSLPLGLGSSTSLKYFAIRSTPLLSKAIMHLLPLRGAAALMASHPCTVTQSDSPSTLVFTVNLSFPQKMQEPFNKPLVSLTAGSELLLYVSGFLAGGSSLETEGAAFFTAV